MRRCGRVRKFRRPSPGSRATGIGERSALIAPGVLLHEDGFDQQLQRTERVFCIMCIGACRVQFIKFASEAINRGS